MKSKNSTQKIFSFNLARKKGKKRNLSVPLQKLRWYLVPALAFFAITAFKTVEILRTTAGHQPAPVEDFVNFETAHVHPLEMTPDGNKLLAVNTANNSLEVFEVNTSGLVHTASIPVGLDPVTVRARSNTEVWVVNSISDDVSLVDLTLGVVTKSIKVSNEPADVVFAGSPLKAFVSSSEPSVISIFNLNNLNASPTVVPVIGEELRSLAVSPDGLSVYGAFFESGNQSTLVNGDGDVELSSVRPSNEVNLGPYGNVVVPPNDGNAFNPPIGRAGLPPYREGMIVKKNASGQWMDDNNGNWTQVITGGIGARVAGWDMRDRDVAILNANSFSVNYQRTLGNILMAMAVNPQTGKVSVVGTDATNEIRFEPVLNGTFLRVNISQFNPGSNNNDIIDLNDHLDYSSPLVPISERQKSIGDPRGIVWKSNGTEAYITGMGSNNVIIVNQNGVRINAQPIQVGEGPTGIVLDEVNGMAYVLNKFDASISRVDMNTDLEVDQLTFLDPTPAEIKTGRKHLYNTHTGSGLGHIACASCHVDGKTDRLAWDLGNPAGNWQDFPSGATLGANGSFIPDFTAFHPMKGPKTTQTLQDIIDQNQLLHWRGDRESLGDFALAFFLLQGAEGRPSNSEMQEFEDFLRTIHFPPNPHRNLDNSFSTSVSVPGAGNTTRFIGNAESGRNFFLTAIAGGGNQCLVCHEANTGRSKSRLSFDNAKNTGGFRGELDKMGLFYNSVDGSTAGFGFLNDGGMDSNFPFHFNQTNGNFLAFMMSFEGSEFGASTISQPSQDSHAGVGQHTTVKGSFENGQQAFLNQLKGIVEQSNRIGLVVSGTFQGELRNFFYQGNNTYQSDRSAQSVSHSNLVSAALGGEALSWLVVHDEIKIRASVDRNSNGIFDGDENAAPVASFTVTPDNGEAPLPVSFDANASTDDNGIVNYAWDFGDGNTGSGITASHTYALEGIYTATLTVSDQEGLTNIASQTITVTEEPVQGDCFIVGSNGEVWIEAENFSSQTPGSGNASASNWQTYSDGTASSGIALRAEPNVGVYTGLSANGPRLDYKIFFDTPGNYSVFVRGTGPAGTDDSFHAGLNGNPLTTTAGYGMIVPTSWSWASDANDAIALVINIPSPGQYTFNLWMREDGVSVDKILLSSLGNSPSGTGLAQSSKGDCGGQVSNQAPVASFTATPPSGLAPLAVSFDATSSTDDNGIVSYNWDFGDGTTGSGVNASHSYTTVGQFTASLTVSDAEGLSNSISQVIEVQNPGTENCFAEVNGEVVIEAENFSDLSPGTGNAAASTWSLISDANASGGQALAAGPNTGVWTGLNINGPRLDYNIDFSETGVYQIYILTSAPGPNDDSYHVGLDGNSVSSNSGWGMGLNGPWAWADYANEDDFVEVNVASAGKHTFNVWMREDGVEIDKIVLRKAGGVPIGQGPSESGQSPCGGNANQAPIASFNATPSSGFAPLLVNIDAGASTDPDGSIASYSWSFGDGANGSGQTLTHTYTNVGSYTLTLTVTDNEGLTNQSSRTITVSPNGNGPLCHQELAGVVVMEAENYSARSTGTGNASGSNWQSFSSSNASNGEGMKAMPNTGVYTGLATNGPRLDYDITFQTAGTYRVYIRANGPTGTDDSFHAGLNGVSTTNATAYGMGYTAVWFWAEEANDDPFVEVVVPTTGQHTFNIWMREDGVEIDKIVLKVSPGTPSGQGPTESALAECADQTFTNETFAVQEEGGNADLNWSNFFEEFKDSYVLERSVDGITFEQLKAEEISVDKLLNEHIDPDVHQYKVDKLFYRLRIKDSYGRTRKERTGVLNLRTTAPSFAFKAFPIPARDKLNVEYDNSSGKPLNLKVMSALGQTVHTESLDGRASFGLIKLNVEHYAEGVYFIQLSDGVSQQVIRILVE